jgi:GAF domain-containing protein
VNEPNSSGNPEFLKDLKLINDQLSTTDPNLPKSVSQTRSDLNELADLAARDPEEGFRLYQELEQACLATSATGGAIALVRGEKIVCHAAAGPDAPDIGVCLDPRNGLSGACIQTRQVQQCSDTETDPRVDPVACRSLGVRSIVVLPLIEGDKLFGIFEVLSSRPNAFSQADLDTLQALTDRIVRSRSQNWEATPTVPPKESAAFSYKVDEVAPQAKSRSSKSDSVFPRRERMSKRSDLTATVLGILVIASALLLGTLVGWRMGWQRATLALRASSKRYRTIPPSKTGPIGRTVLPANDLPPSSARTDECGESAPAGPQTQPLSGGLTVCQEGRIIFRLPASAPPPTRNLRTAQHSPALPADPKRK